MSRAVQHRTRVRVADHATLLSCGHRVQPGGQAVSRNRGPWVCRACADVTRAARTVGEVLAAERRHQ